MDLMFGLQSLSISPVVLLLGCLRDGEKLRVSIRIGSTTPNEAFGGQPSRRVRAPLTRVTDTSA